MPPLMVQPAPVAATTTADVPSSALDVPLVAGAGGLLATAVGLRCLPPTRRHHDCEERRPGRPDLTHYQGNPDFLRQWLRHPRAIRPNTFMPNLDLSEAEIEALVAFLSADAK
jgi:hypothetical protein